MKADKSNMKHPEGFAPSSFSQRKDAESQVVKDAQAFDTNVLAQGVI
jgi:hypothetical protein